MEKMSNNFEFLVSVIVPAYNVGAYISECIDSLLVQTYKHTEIIIVNDGSTDNTELMLRKYDGIANVKIINIDNSGVSNARNTGLKNSLGDFVLFVDGDDFVSPDFVEYFLNLIVNSSADFCFSKNCFFGANEKQSTKALETKILSPDEAVAMLLSPEIVVGCWNKIYSSHFLKRNNILFDTGLFYGEGLRYIVESSLKASTVCMGWKKTYYYRKNNMSSATTNFNLDRMINGEKSLEYIGSIINLHDKNVNDQFLLHLTTYYVSALSRLIAYKEKKKNLSLYKTWQKKAKSNLKTIIRSKNISIYRKTLVVVGTFFPHLISILDTARRKRIQNKAFKE